MWAENHSVCGYVAEVHGRAADEKHQWQRGEGKTDAGEHKGVDAAQAKFGNRKIQAPDQGDEYGKCQVFFLHGLFLKRAGVF